MCVIGSDINSAHTYTCKVYSSSVMDPGFKVMLQENDVGVPILRVLELDGVISERIFHLLKLKDMAWLLEREGMPVGAHALF